jgi:S1-C subfamily serine protease
MRNLVRTLILLVPLLLGGTALAEERADLAPVKAIEAAVKKGIARASPSIACIYVSRSDAYHKAPYWGVLPPRGSAGQLGRFDAAAAARKVPADARQRALVLRTIRDHDLSAPNNVPESYGSGIVVASSGLVLTNAHVVHNATKIYVRLSGRRGSWADIHASDPRSDLAVLRLLDKVPNLEALKLGAGEKVRKGQFVIALSNEFSPGFRDGRPSAAWGIISNLRQRAPGDLEKMDRAKITLHHYGTLLQTDARIRLGASGGALIGLDGAVIGLTTVLAGIRGNDNPGAQAIPLDAETRRIIEVLKRGEEVEYGFLGVVLAPDARIGPGVRISATSPNSPAARAGLRGGDTIVRINGNPVRANNDLFLLIGMSLAGGTARVEVVRGGGAPLVFNVKLEKFHVQGPIIAARRPPALGGLRVDYLSILAQRGAIPRWGRWVSAGVVIREVVPKSPADKADLQPDKVITHVDGRAVNVPAEYYAQLARAKGRVELTILDSDGRPERVSLDLK